MPIVEVATVSGSSVAMKGGGAPTSSSSVPCQRCHWIAPPEPKSVADQMPISPAPSATYSSVPDWFPLSTMKNAIEAKITGWRTVTSRKNSECVRFFRWKSQPTQKRRACTATR